MRYGNPSINYKLNNLKEKGCENVIVLPLYPQYSAATSGSSIKEWHDECKKNDYNVNTSTICCYPTETNFINAHINEIKDKIKNFDGYKLIFSAHGLGWSCSRSHHFFGLCDSLSGGPHQTLSVFPRRFRRFKQRANSQNLRAPCDRHLLRWKHGSIGCLTHCGRANRFGADLHRAQRPTVAWP